MIIEISIFLGMLFLGALAIIAYKMAVEFMRYTYKIEQERADKQKNEEDK